MCQNMNTLDKKMMLDYILTTIKEKNITVYAIAKATNIKQTTIHNIVNKRTLNPHANNVKLIYDYLDKKFGGTGENPLYQSRKSQKENVPVFIQQGDLEKMLELKIEEVVRKLTDDKFKEINENLLYLIRKSLDDQLQDKSEIKKSIEKLK